MSKLGVRYIAVLRNPNVDGFDGNEPWTEAGLYINKDAADKIHKSFTAPIAEHVATLAVDIDSLPPAEASEHEQHQRARAAREAVHLSRRVASRPRYGDAPDRRANTLTRGG